MIDPTTGLQNGAPVQLDTSTGSSMLGLNTSLPDQIFATPTTAQDGVVAAALGVGVAAIKPEDLLIPKTEPMEAAPIVPSTAPDAGTEKYDGKDI